MRFLLRSIFTLVDRFIIDKYLAIRELVLLPPYARSKNRRPWLFSSRMSHNSIHAALFMSALGHFGIYKPQGMTLTEWSIKYGDEIDKRTRDVYSYLYTS